MSIKIPISADVKNVQKGVEDIGKTVEKINKTKWAPIDLKQLEKDLARAQEMILDFRRHVAAPLVGVDIPARGGSNSRPPGPPPGAMYSVQGKNYGWNKVPSWGAYGAPPGGVMHLPGGGAFNWQGHMGGGSAPPGSAPPAGGGSSGGGGFGMGGMLGNIKGLFAGLTVASLISKGIGLTQESYGMAKDRGESLDALKRQMGDVGISFGMLKATSEGAAHAIGMSSKETARLMEEFNKLSKGVDKTEEGLMDSAITSGRIGRAYGVDPSASAGFFAGVRHMDPRQNNRELALLLGETIQKSGMNSNAADVMQAIQSFASTAARMSLTGANLNAYAGSYSEMVGSHTAGLDSQNAANILSQASGAVSRMGGAGEAGQAFILRAFSQQGSINPIMAAALAQGGLFGTRNSVFGGENNQIAKFLGAGSVAGLTGGANGDVTNFESIKRQLSRMGGDRAFQLEGAQRLFGVSSLSQAASLLNLSGSQAGGLQKSLRNAGVDINTLNESGIQTLAKIGGAGSKEELQSIFEDMAKRTGRGSLTSEERKSLDEASGFSTEEFRTALIKVAAIKDQQETDTSKMVRGMADIETAMTKIGDALIPATNVMRDALIKMSGMGSFSLAKEARRLQIEDVNKEADSAIDAIRDTYNAKKRNARQSLYGDAIAIDGVRGANRFGNTETENLTAYQNSEIDRIERMRKQRLAEIQQSPISTMGMASSDSATPLPPGAASGNARDQLDVNVNVNSKQVAADGRVISESKTTSRVGVPRGSGRQAVSADAR